MDTTVTATAEPKKRGRPRKVVSEDAQAQVGEVKTVRKASKKTLVAGTKEGAVKKGKTTTAPAIKTKTKATAAPKTAAVEKASKTTSAPKSTSTSKGPSTASNPEEKLAEEKAKANKSQDTKTKLEGKTTPATLSTSRILDEVYKTGTVKPPPSPVDKLQKTETTLGAGNTAPVEVPSTTTTTATPTPSAPPQAQAQSPPQPPPSAPQPTASKTPRAPLPSRTTTIPLPTRPLNPSSTPAHPRPRPPPTPSPEALEAMETERAIREGRMPPKYKGAARRVTAIIVGIPVILVVGMELWRRWDDEIRVKYGGRGVGGEKEKEGRRAEI